MSDQGNAGGTGAGSSGTGTATANEPSTELGPDGKPWDQERAMAAIAQLREERNAAKATAREAEALKAKLAAIETEKLSETEKLQRERDTEKAGREAAEARIADRELHDALVAAAREGKAKPGREDAVARLIDRAAVTNDGDGKPTNLKALVEAVRTSAPELFEPVTPGGDAEGGVRSGAPAGDSMDSRIRKGFGRST